MLILNDQENLSLLLTEYRDFLISESNVIPEVQNRYYDDIKYYFFKVLTRKSDIKNFFKFFEGSYISELYDLRSGDTVSAALLLLLYNMKEKIGENQILIIKERLVALKPVRPIFQYNFISPEKVEFLFSDNVKYKFDSNRAWDYTNYRLIGPLIWSLAYDCGMEQKHITQLFISDFDLVSKTVRNLRQDKNPNTSKWFVLPTRTLKLLNEYLNTRESLIGDDLIIINGKPINTAEINKTFEILGRKGNKEYLDNKKPSVELLVRSGILRSLEETAGVSLIEHTMIHGTSRNSQLINATNEYLRIKNNHHAP
jgi:integrase